MIKKSNIITKFFQIMFDKLLFFSIKLQNQGGKFDPRYKNTVTTVILSTLN